MYVLFKHYFFLHIYILTLSLKSPFLLTLLVCRIKPLFILNLTQSYDV